MKLIVAAWQVFGELVMELSLAEQNIVAKQHLLESYILRWLWLSNSWLRPSYGADCGQSKFVGKLGIELIMAYQQFKES